MVDGDQQVEGHVRNLEEWITTQPDWAQQHLVAMLFGAFAALALSLAAVGLYSVVSYTSVRVGGGIVAGILLSLAIKRVIMQWVQGSSISFAVLLGVILLLAVVGGTACLLPARRASSIDPMQALRYE